MPDRLLSGLGISRTYISRDGPHVDVVRVSRVTSPRINVSRYRLIRGKSMTNRRRPTAGLGINIPIT